METDTPLGENVPTEEKAEGADSGQCVSADSLKKKNKRRSRNRNKRVGGDEADATVSANVAMSDGHPPGKVAQDGDDSCKTPQGKDTSNMSRPRGQGSARKVADAVDHRTCRMNEPKADSFKYWSKENIAEALQLGTVLEGPLRVNPKNYRQCFIPHTNNVIDVYIPWRNRGMNGDIAAVHLLDRQFSRVLVEDLENFIKRKQLDDVKLSTTHAQASNGMVSHLDYVRLRSFMQTDSEVVEMLKAHFPGTVDFPDKFLQPVGVVVGIREEKHSRIVAGTLQPRTDNNTKFALFVPNDSRVPRCDIPISACPKNFLKRPQDSEDVIFVVKYAEWREGMARASGTIVRALGSRSEVEPMTEALLMEHGVEFADFIPQVEQCLPTDLPWRIPTEELTSRRDFTKECVFTIDPATARDLDDALSCKKLDDDTYEVGVHIADVSYFIEQGNELDREAASRATSVYMVQRVIPMLPRLLCEQLCSLNPDEKRLAFSVVWHIDTEGNITDEWFGRTVINSCVKLSYQHAQGFIEEPDRDWRVDELPRISEGFTVSDIKDRVLVLDKIAKCLRKKRFDGGALRLDQTKLSYTLNPDSGYPTGYYVYQLKDSNRMIEEYMLLANMAVARKIYKSFPEKAVLRRHPEPQDKQLSDLEQSCTNMGLEVDVSSSQTLHESLKQYIAIDTEESVGKFQILMQLCVKPMQRALYFCTGSLGDEALFRHYALSVPFYTHFTSPIRRYADVMVHRVLAASLGYCDPPVTDTREIEAQARHCNDKKDNAKGAGDLSVQMFFVAFLKECGPLMENVMIMGILDKAVDVVCIKLGYKKRIYMDKLQLAGPPVFNNQGTLPTLTLAWPSQSGGQSLSQTLRLFDIVKCQLIAGKDLLEFQAVLQSPDNATAQSIPSTD